MGLTSLILLPFALNISKTELKGISSREFISLSIVGLTLALHFFFFISAVKMTTVANAVILVTSHPLIVCILSSILFREPIHHWIIGALVGFAGVTLIYSGNRGIGENMGNFLALLGAVAAAIYIISGRVIRQKMGLIAYVFIVYSFSSIFLFMACLITNAPLWPYPVHELTIFLSLAIVSTIFGHTLFNYSLKYLPATFISISFLGEPIGATLFAALFLGETPSVVAIFGGSLVVIGIMIAAWKSRLVLKASDNSLVR
ncbi:MAG: DMT family transporter [Methanomassiliicoccales archaeon]|jgi:drug/metabolite transporter (DMT)-like permease|nr:DMT family transporter [Methanomassiliicoccales archaeon]